MIKIQTIVRDIVLSETEAYYALLNGFMNMSGYAERIRHRVERLTKKQVTLNGIVVALSRLKKEFKKITPLVHEVAITNITTKLPLSEIIYENTSPNLARLESFHKKIPLSRDDFFTATVSPAELNIVCSSSLTKKVLKHFTAKPKFTAHELAAVGVSFGPNQFQVPNTLFSLISVVARARINIAEIVSTYTELIFIISEKDFSKTVDLFSALHKKAHELKK